MSLLRDITMVSYKGRMVIPRSELASVHIRSFVVLSAQVYIVSSRGTRAHVYVLV